MSYVRKFDLSAAQKDWLSTNWSAACDRKIRKMQGGIDGGREICALNFPVVSRLLPLKMTS